MRYHDYHLRGFQVTDFGKRIVLDLVWNKADELGPSSLIRFDAVELHHFVLASSAIITDIDEVPLDRLLGEQAVMLDEWNRLHGIAGWGESMATYKSYCSGNKSGIMFFGHSSQMDFESVTYGSSPEKKSRFNYRINIFRISVAVRGRFRLPLDSKDSSSLSG